MRRREFVTLLGGAAAAWPLVARAQQAAMPVIGYLDGGVPEARANLTAAFRKGLSETGYAEGRNVTVEYRYANNEVERLPELAADLVRRRVAVIVVVAGGQTARAAKAATTTIPLIFGTAGDPVQEGLVESFNRPGGNATGFSNMAVELTPKRFGLLQECLPVANRFSVLISSASASQPAPLARWALSAAAAIGKQIEILTVNTSRDIDSVFAAFVHKRIDALVVNASNLFSSRLVQLVTLSAHHRLPTIYYDRPFADSGGLMSYGASIPDQARQVGVYTGRVLKGEKPADLPVMQPTRFELVINLQTARTLGLEVPPGLLAIADAVIE